MEWHGLEPPSGGYDRPPEVANADVGGVGDWELAGVGGVCEWELAGPRAPRLPPPALMA